MRLAGALESAPAGTFLSLDLCHAGVDQPGDAAGIDRTFDQRVVARALLSTVRF
jgi:hypothetical protein